MTTPTRDEVMQRFGPLLLEALVLLLLEEINEMRHGQGNPPATIEELFDRIDNHMNNLEPYDWMSEEL